MEVAAAFVSLVPTFKGGAGKIGEELGGPIAKAGEDGGKRFGGTFLKASAGPLKSVVGVVGGPLAGAFAAVASIHALSGFISDARESAKIGALTAQVIKSTGGAAKITASQVGDLATAISNKTGVDDEAIQSGENLLLTFTNVKNEAGKGNDIFNQATQTITDLSVALGQDTKSSAIQLGKALNDPIKGVTALSRVGVSFTAQQQEQIKTLVKSGDTLGAQKVILGELNKEFGGAAAAASTPFDKLKVSLGNVGETIGGAFIPLVDKGATFLTDRLLPAVTGLFDLFKTGNFSADLGKALGLSDDSPVVAGLLKLRDAAISFGNFLTGTVVPAAVSFGQALIRWQDFLVPIAAAVAAIVGAFQLYQLTLGVVSAVTKVFTAVQAALNVVLSANPIGLVLLALVGLAAGLATAYAKSETFRNIVNTAFTKVKTVVLGTLDAVTGAVKAAFGFVTSAAGSVLGFLRANWPLLLGILTGPIGLAVVAIARNWDTIKAGVAALKDAVVGKFGELVSFVGSVPGKIVGALGDVGSLLLGVGRNIVQGLINGIKGMAGAVVDALVGLLPGPLKKFAGALGIASPSKKFAEFGRFVGEGFALGIDSTQARVSASVQGMAASALATPILGAPDLASVRGPSLADVPVGSGRGASGGYAGPDTLVVVDADGQLIGRMRVEASGQIGRELGGVKQMARAR